MNLWNPSKQVRSAINSGEKKFREWSKRLGEEAAVELQRYRERQELARLHALQNQALEDAEDFASRGT